MRSTERILRFMDIPEESSGFVVTPPPPDWPSAGHLEVVNLSMRHSPTAPYVLQNISFNVQQGQKVLHAACFTMAVRGVRPPPFAP